MEKGRRLGHAWSRMRAKERGSPPTIYGQFQQRILKLRSMRASGDQNEDGAPILKILTTLHNWKHEIWL